jgi:hypothetical protein
MGNAARAAIYVHLQALASREQQERYAQKYCDQHGYTPTTLVFHPDDALRLVKGGFVDVVVCAYLPRDRVDLATLVEKAGGKLESARTSGRIEREYGAVIAKLFDRGMTVAEIADVTDSPTGEIRRELFNRGLGG